MRDHMMRDHISTVSQKGTEQAGRERKLQTLKATLMVYFIHKTPSLKSSVIPPPPKQCCQLGTKGSNT